MELEKKIYIGFSKPKKHPFPIFSWLIRMVEWTPYSHVYVRWFSEKTGMWLQYEASGTLVHFLGEEAFEKKIQPIKEYEILITQNEYTSLLKFCFKNAGMNYGLSQVFGIGLSKLAGFFTKSINKIFNTKLKEKFSNPFKNGRSLWVCSELVGAIIGELGEKIPIDLDLAGPKDIDFFLQHWERAKIKQPK